MIHTLASARRTKGSFPVPLELQGSGPCLDRYQDTEIPVTRSLFHMRSARSALEDSIVLTQSS